MQKMYVMDLLLSSAPNSIHKVFTKLTLGLQLPPWFLDLLENSCLAWVARNSHRTPNQMPSPWPITKKQLILRLATVSSTWVCATDINTQSEIRFSNGWIELVSKVTKSSCFRISVALIKFLVLLMVTHSCLRLKVYIWGRCDTSAPVCTVDRLQCTVGILDELNYWSLISKGTWLLCHFRYKVCKSRWRALFALCWSWPSVFVCLCR